MRFLSVAIILLSTASTNSFLPQATFSSIQTTTSTRAPNTALNAIGVLARKAKEAQVQKYLSEDPPESILNLLNKIKSHQSSDDAPPLPRKTDLQTALTKRKGTITIIAEYKRRLDKGAFIDEILDAPILSPAFREAGAAAVAVMADDRMGGCDYDDVVAVKTEQETARGDVPGPCFVVSSDLIVDEVQLARSKDAGADAVLVDFGVVGGEERVKAFIDGCGVLEMECIVGVSTREQAEAAVALGARIVCVVGVSDVDEKAAVVEGLSSPEEGDAICTVAAIIARDDKSLEEVEEAWILRDKGFNAVWVSDCLYKSGNDPIEAPGNIIRSMKAKSSVKYASPKAKHGKGEGAREYLGDILM